MLNLFVPGSCVLWSEQDFHSHHADGGGRFDPGRPDPAAHQEAVVPRMTQQHLPKRPVEISHQPHSVIVLGSKGYPMEHELTLAVFALGNIFLKLVQDIMCKE